VPAASYLLLLNRNDSIIPAVARLSREQAGAYFMLGETRGTSAGGKAEAGKSLRVPGTNPFFFNNDALQGNRLIELLDTMPDLEVYVMNTGAVGGPEGDPAASKVKIADSSAVITGIVSGTIEWETDPDFGYEVASSIPDFADGELLQPKRLYERQGRLDEYVAIVEKLHAERQAYLRSFPGLDQGIVEAI
jgi:phosphoenolpyruvate carboxykinase (ATP)